MNDYSDGELIGSGGFGVVYLRRHRHTGEQTVDKQVTIRNDAENSGALIEVHAMLRLMQDNAHQNVVRLKGFLQEKCVFHVYLEYCDGRDLRVKINFQKEMKLQFEEKSEILVYLEQITRGLAFIHRHNVIHRDLKPENILFADSSKGREIVKISDFGLSALLQHHDSVRTSPKGTLFYMAPEVLLQQAYNYKCDMWSLGVVAYELATFRLPFDDDNVLSLAKLIELGQYELISDVHSEDFRIFVSSLLEVHANRRPDSTQSLKMDLFKDGSGEVSHLPHQVAALSLDQPATGGASQCASGNQISPSGVSPKLAAFVCRDATKKLPALTFLYDEKQGHWRAGASNVVQAKPNRIPLVVWSSACFVSLGNRRAMLIDSLLRIAYITDDIQTGLWRSVAAPTTDRTGETAVRQGNYVVLVGGFNPLNGSNTPSSAVDQFDVHDSQWTPLEPLKKAVMFPAVAVDNGRLLVIGGEVGDDDEVSCLQCYQNDGKWQFIDDFLPHGESNISACCHNGSIFVARKRGIYRLQREQDDRYGLSSVGDSWGRSHSMVSFRDKLVICENQRIWASEPNSGRLTRLPDLPIKEEPIRVFLFVVNE